MPVLYLITGSNGAGKSTVAPDYVPSGIKSNYKIFDGDRLLMDKRNELWPNITKSQKEAKRIASKYVIDTLEAQIEYSLSNGKDYIYEGHFPSYTTWDFPKRFKEAGYKICMLFLGLIDPDLSEIRVSLRKKEGGHDVPRWDIENNFYGNLERLDENYELLNDLNIVDTSNFYPKVLATFESGKLIYFNNDLPEWFIKYLPEITRKISNSSL